LQLLLLQSEPFTALRSTDQSSRRVAVLTSSHKNYSIDLKHTQGTPTKQANPSTMGKAKSSQRGRKVYATRGFKQNSKDGRFLAKLLKTGKVSPGAMPSWIKEMYPRFRVYKRDSFASGLRRMKAKLGLLTRHGGGENTGKLPAVGHGLLGTSFECQSNTLLLPSLSKMMRTPTP